MPVERLGVEPPEEGRLGDRIPSKPEEVFQTELVPLILGQKFGGAHPDHLVS
jgi:hypothetical protein